jgi:L-seryl-tRNA(Ser) seleniumtransferase
MFFGEVFEMLDFYQKFGIKKIINASETYTVLGGSIMEDDTLEAMRQAGKSFVDYPELLRKVCLKAATLTKNEGAFVTSGASAGIILSAGALMINESIKDLKGKEKIEKRQELLEKFPDAGAFTHNELMIFRGAFRECVPYWKLLKLTGAKIVDVEPSLQGIHNAVSERTAACVLFPSPLYEEGIPSCEEAIPVLRQLGVRVIVDASAQLPPPSNLWYYTKKLGADLCVFSGGKHIRGPQSTGLIVGNYELSQICSELASPHERLGRGFKTGKEELAGFITALESFVKTEPSAVFLRQEKLLLKIRKQIEPMRGIRTDLIREGRLGTYQPLLLVWLPQGKTAAACNKYARSLDESIDIGVYTPEFHKPDNLVFINAYNLKDEYEADKVASAIIGYLMEEEK